MRSRRVIYGLVLVAILLVTSVLSACVSVPTAPEAAPPAEAPAEPTTLVVALAGNIEGIDPFALSESRGWMVVRATYGLGFEWGQKIDEETGMCSHVGDVPTIANWGDWSEHRPGLIESWDWKEEGGEVVYTMHVLTVYSGSSRRGMVKYDTNPHPIRRATRVSTIGEYLREALGRLIAHLPAS